MQNSLIELVKYKGEKASQTLQAAETLYREGFYNSSVNRSYYACFYIVTALLQMYNLSSAKHSGVRGLFNVNFIKKGIFDKEIGRFYSEVFNKRQESDYEDYKEFSKEETEEILGKAKLFVKELREFINKKLVKNNIKE
ncbi:MAG: HEPN domain-containing protein [Chlorobi bacterium]|nr:HEPN domain-containing protein [Chlorobiota bacterium]